MRDIVERLRAIARVKGYGTHSEAADEIERLRAIVPQWRPIESAPKDGTLILVRDAKRHWIIRADDLTFAPIYLDKPFAWMPLPSPPEDRT